MTRASPGRLRDDPALPWGVALLVTTAAGMATLSWRRWPDPLIDFGRELYVAWRLAEGAALQTDLLTLNGPLSPYWNASWFALLGPGIDVLTAVNAVVLALITGLLVSLLRRASGPTGAWLGGFVLLTVFGFAQLVKTGNYNFIAPYAHELTHGIALSLAALAALGATARSGGSRPAWLCGIAAGAVFLTKVEVFVALAAALLVGGAALPAANGARRRAAIEIAAGAALAPVFATALLCLRLEPGDAVAATFNGWTRLLGSDVSGMAFYRQGMGIDDVPASLGRIGWATLGWALALAPAAVAAWWGGRDGAWRRALPGAAFGCSLFAVLAAARSIDWFAIARPLPVVLLGLAVVAAAAAWRGNRSPDRVLRLALLVFSGALLGKMALNARINHYGFALAMPATLCVVAALVDDVPALLARRGLDGRSFRAGALGVVLACVLVHVQISRLQLVARSETIGAPPDAIRIDPPRAKVLDAALDVIRARTRPEDTLVALPEGTMLNYLTRRASSVPFVAFTPFELRLYGEPAVSASLHRQPPDFVALVHRNTAEFGARFLGKQYGEALFAWIRRDYRPVAKVGATPLQAVGQFGILLLERADRGTPTDERP